MTEYKSFLERIQSAPEAQKKRWMAISTIVVMAIVVYVWLMYFNNLVAGFSAATTEAGPVAQAPSAGDNSGGGITIMSTLEDSLANLYQIFMSKARDLGNILQTPREYIINPPK